MGLQDVNQWWSMKISIVKIGPRSERHLVWLVTLRAHNVLSKVQGKTSFHMVVEVEQQDLETSLRRVWHTRKRLSVRGGSNCCGRGDEVIQWPLQHVVRDAHQDYNQLLGDDERGRDDDWFDDVDTQVCSFKRKVRCWIREAAQRAKSSKCSSRSSRSDRGSMNSKKSKGSRVKQLKGI